MEIKEANNNLSKSSFFYNLTIRSMMKNIDDMTMKCPMNWNIKTLKDFITKYDQNAIHTYKLESWTLFFAGKILKDEEIIQNILENVSECLYKVI